MKHPALAVLILALCTCGPARSQSGPPSPLCEPAPPAAAIRLCMQNGSEGDPSWWLLEANAGRKEIPPPQASMSQVTSLAISPTGRWLAVSSVGEGHPILEVFALAPVLAGEAPEPTRMINPYPGGIALIGWQGDRLHLESDRLLTIDPLPFGVEPELEQAIEFTLDPESGRIERHQP